MHIQNEVLARPQKDELTPPENTVVAIGSNLWGQTAGWLDGLSGGAGAGGWQTGWQADYARIDAADAALTDTKASGVLSQRIEGVIASPLIIEPGGKKRRDKQAADDLRDQIKALDIDRICRELLHSIWYGYAIAECIWVLEGTRVRLVDIRVRDPRILRFDLQTHEPLLLTRNAPGGMPIPPAKFLILQNPRAHGGYPFGLGAAQWCIWPVWLKRQIFRMWGTALEKFGSPTLVGKHRKEATPEEINKLLRNLAAAVASSGLVIPEGQEVQLLGAVSGGGGRGSGGGDYKEMVAALDRMIAEAVVGQHATSEIGQHVGTAQVQNETLQNLIAGDEHRLSECLRTGIATWLAAWNFPGAQVPAIRRDTAPPEDLKVRSERDANIARASGLRPKKEYIEDVYGGTWEEAPQRSVQTLPDPGGQAPVTMSGPFYTLADPSVPLSSLDRLVNHLIEEDIATATAAAMIAPVEAAIAGATSLEELRASLGTLADRSPPEALTTLLARADFAAGLAGVSGAPILGGETEDG
ncbi:phage portal protein family protein [Ruegeria atlantica]|uniref:phage portal protein family protein n=1 Tax=Ruegeria atlantica TaxID=81569 RepID=UPI00147DB61C|nr:DUF935 family protein [Ruegeria atlantica]